LRVRLIRSFNSFSFDSAIFTLQASIVSNINCETNSRIVTCSFLTILQLQCSSQLGHNFFPLSQNDDQNVWNTRKGSRKESPASAAQNIPGIFSITIFLL
jgi:hypothetical protein